MKAAITIFTALLFMVLAGQVEEAAQGETRVVFIGDSITGQGGGWLDTGYVFKMREALSAVHPERTHNLVPLGGSGMGVSSWLALARDDLGSRNSRGFFLRNRPNNFRHRH